MGSPVEIIPGWEAINDRLDSTLVQLNRLIHHYADVPLPEDVEGTYPGRDPGCVSEECLETDIQEILRQAHVRLREFTESMGFKNGLPDQRGNQFQGANEELERSLAQADHRNSLLKEELARAQHDLADLKQKITQYEDTIDQFREEGVPNIKQARELERAKAELIEKTKEFADTSASIRKTEKELAECKQAKKQELAREKIKKQRELRELKENFQKEVLTATQQHLDREMELQEFCQREKDAHSKTVEDMMTLHTEEVKKLKAEHAIKLEECCQNHASLESEWQDKEFELHKKIAVAVQERTRYIQLLFDEHLKVQALESQLSSVQSDLSNEKLAKSQLENELKLMKVDVSLANEKVEMGLKAQEHTKSQLQRVQDEMMDMKRTSAADLAKLEEKAFTLQKNLSCVTNTCVQSEHELHTQSKKVLLLPHKACKSIAPVFTV
ncbi:hypothetical protein KC19_5G149500 [Ceratodon purpureus]|uniref:Uncharacterized protein n=1 Tax=Ceratodon purpureus TaxID=3225 RepID=A0A8T0I2K0_CERPU|nr:hypothetical protein KC19_5G149500 [Ceratodon purpureus]